MKYQSPATAWPKSGARLPTGADSCALRTAKTNTGGPPTAPQKPLAGGGGAPASKGSIVQPKQVGRG